MKGTAINVLSLYFMCWQGSKEFSGVTCSSCSYTQYQRNISPKHSKYNNAYIQICVLYDSYDKIDAIAPKITPQLHRAHIFCVLYDSYVKKAVGP
jgi:hypothetical protein